MEICVETSDGEKYTVDVGVDDTIADIRQKVASAAELCEDSFDMSFGGKVLADGDDTTQLSAGDTVVLTKTKSQKEDAIAALRDLGETNLTTDRFEGLTDPMLVHLFLHAEVVTEIPSGFLRDCSYEELDLSGVPAVTHILDSFLCNCYSLHTVDLSGWSNVTQIGHRFLQCCTALQTVDCTSLTTLDLSGWSSVTRIPNHFLSGCTALQTADLSGWSSVTFITYYFLYNCRDLRTLDLSGWASVTHIGQGVLDGCNLRKCSINVTGSSSVLSEYVHSRSKRECVLM